MSNCPDRSKYRTRVEDEVSPSDSRDVPIILQFMNTKDGNPVPKVQGASTESRRILNDIETHDVYESSNLSESSINEPVYPFALHQNIEGVRDIETYKDDEILPKSYENLQSRRFVGRRKRKGASTTTHTDNNTNFEVLTDDLEREDAKQLLSMDEKFKYGNADPQIPPSTIPCSGCGAHLQCCDSKFPGFLPVELFASAKSDNVLRELRCQRCYIMKKYDVALKVTVSPDDYPKTIAHLKEKRAIIVLIVDLTDFPGSVWPDILNELGPNKKILLVGNKIDLLPADSNLYLKRIEQSMVKAFKEKCLEYHYDHVKELNNTKEIPEIVHSILVSARTGYNIEVLIDKIYSFWNQNYEDVGGDIYLIGTTNVGKSSLFNMLVDSDLCKISAQDRVNKAMISTVPGTTLNLLKFPIIRPDPSRISQRRLRLKKQKDIFRKSEELRIEKLRQTKDRKYSILGFPVGRTFNYQDKNSMDLLDAFHLDHRIRPKWNKKLRSIDPNHTQFSKSNWCYDTPGSVSTDQLINILTQEELRKTIPHSLPIQPRSFLLSVGQSIFLGGLGRLDIIEGPTEQVDYESPNWHRRFKILVTAFVADDLPIHIVLTQDADSFYSEALAADILGAPSTLNGTDIERLKDFPELKGKIMMIDGVTTNESSCDIVLSSAGWISLTPKVSEIFKVQAWTPGGRGLTIRDPPFLPYAAQLRGYKMIKSPAFQYGKPFVVNKREYNKPFQ